MRTTVTIDADTDALLRGEVERSGLSFKEVLNRAIRQSLGEPGEKIEVRPIFNAPFPAELEGRSFNRLADEWDDEDTLRELGA